MFIIFEKRIKLFVIYSSKNLIVKFQFLPIFEDSLGKPGILLLYALSNTLLEGTSLIEVEDITNVELFKRDFR